LLATLLPGGVTLAQTGSPRVFLVPFTAPGAGGSDLVTGRLTEQLRGDLEGRNGSIRLLVDPVAPGPEGGLVADGTGSTQEGVLAPARRHYAIGVGLIGMERFEEAIVELKEAIRLFEGNLARLKPEAIGEVIQTYVQLSVAQMRAGYEDDAEEAIAHVIRIDPQFNPAGKGLPPVYQKIVARHRRKIEKQGSGVLEIISNPPTAKVFVDGKDVGETPVIVKKVSAGQHYVQLARPLAGLWAERVEFPGAAKKDKRIIDLPPIGGEVEVNEVKEQSDLGARSTLEAVQGILRTGLADIKLKQRAYELALRTGADYVVLGHVNTLPSGYRLRPMILQSAGVLLADLGRVQLDFELMGSAVQMKEVGDKVMAALGSFPETLVPDQAPEGMVAAAQLVAAAAEAAPEVVAGGLQPSPWPVNLPPRPAPPGPTLAAPPARPPVVQPPVMIPPGKPSLPPSVVSAPVVAPPVAPPVVTPPARPPVMAAPVVPPPVVSAPVVPPPVVSAPVVPPPVVSAPVVSPPAKPPVMAAPVVPPPARPPVMAAPVVTPPVVTTPVVTTPVVTTPVATLPLVQPPQVGRPVLQSPPPPAGPVVQPPPVSRPVIESPPLAVGAPVVGGPAVTRPVLQSPPPPAIALATPPPAQPAIPPSAPASLPQWSAGAGPALGSIPAAPITPPPSEPPVWAAAPGTPGVRPTPSDPKDQDEHRKWYEKPWAWGATAVVVGGGAAALVLLLGEQEQERPARGVIPEVSIR
jgi:hypothetical protein